NEWMRSYTNCLAQRRTRNVRQGDSEKCYSTLPARRRDCRLTTRPISTITFMAYRNGNHEVCRYKLSARVIEWKRPMAFGGKRSGRDTRRTGHYNDVGLAGIG